MNSVDNYLTFKIASGQGYHDRFRSHVPSWFFFCPEVYLFIGVLHSSSFPDYIEDKKSGGQQTDCLNKNLCNDSTINTGLADRMIKQMLKTVMRG